MKRYLPYLRLVTFAAFALTCLEQSSWAEDQSGDATSTALSRSSDKDAPSAEVKAAPLGAPSKPAVAALGKPNVAPLGKPGKPKFAMKMTGAGGAGGAAPDRAAEVKRLIDAYHSALIDYAFRMMVAVTPEQKDQAKLHEPSARALRPMARLIAEIVAVDPTDEPALDALLFLKKYVGIPEIDATLAEAVRADGGEGINPSALLVEHHADNPKVADALITWPISPDNDELLLSLFQKSHNPKVRAMAGIVLVKSLQKNEKSNYAEQLAEAMAADHYLAGVAITAKADGPTARDWAEGKLRELRLLVVGKELPDVSGKTLKGVSERISDYRGKVVVVDFWTTWCGPCQAMIPHQTEMVDRFRDEPFVLLSVSCDAELETLEGYLEKQAMPWNHWWVGTGSDLQKTLNIASFPTVIVLDANGVIRHKNIKDEELEEAVTVLLEEAKASRDPS